MNTNWIKNVIEITEKPMLGEECGDTSRVGEILDTLFSDYVLPDPFTFDVVDDISIASKGDGVFDDKEKILKKHPSAVNRLNDRAYIMNVAKYDPHILAIADDKIKNDAEVFLTLCKNKIICAQYIGNELRQNKQFLFALDELDNRCWKYIQKRHCIGPSTLEQKISMWCLSWLSNYIRHSSGGWTSMCASIDKKDGTTKYLSWLGISAMAHKIYPNSPKEDVIKFINEYKCYTVDSFYAPISKADAEIAERMLAYDYHLVLDLSNVNQLLKDYDFVMKFWEKNRLLDPAAQQSIRNFSSDRALAKLLLEERGWGSTLEFFSPEIRGDKEYILKLLFTPDKWTIENNKLYPDAFFGKLLPQDLIYATDELKFDKDFLERIGEHNRRSLRYWESRVHTGFHFFNAK